MKLNPLTLLSSIVILLTACAALNRTQAEETVIQVQADQVLHPVSRFLTGACIEDANHEIYGGIYSQMIFGESFQEPPPAVKGSKSPEISGMWRAVGRGTATGQFALIFQRPFAGKQSQQLSFVSGDGQWGIENQGLNRWGMSSVAGKPYEGYVWARAEKPTTLFATLESRDGSRVYAETPLVVSSNDWQRLDFTLTPSAADKAGRFALTLKQPGTVTLGHAYLQPGAWGRFKGLPVRRDVAEGLINQGVTLLRYGGSMVNCAGYKWKNMVGPRDRRPPYTGLWYRYSSNGWGIPDFMSFCEAAGFEYVPDFDIDETPQDMADFIQYAKGSADSAWGRKRAADGHPSPYKLPFIELGNEERVDEKYFAKFKPIAEAIWAMDPEIILVVGDHFYQKPIVDPYHVAGGSVTTLAGQKQILDLAKSHDREVWFDVHVDTERPVKSNASLDGMFSFFNALDKIADGAKHKVVVFEYNAHNHAVKRAVANAIATHAIERDGRLPLVCSATGLQPDGQNDNGWDQGLLFLTPSQVWLQPPGYVTQMFSRNYLPQLVKSEVSGAQSNLSVSANRSADGKTLVLQAVNSGDQAVAAQINLSGFVPTRAQAKVTELAGPMDAVNTAEKMDNVVPKESDWTHGLKEGKTSYAFPPHSLTVLRFE